ncbi:hypothetical protein Ais01nite_33550 [Asanoa ishikariensis]|uniref:hypothetical protein n=1 Tax=Asanoa ishikariensis TaxID=137265 RepID=UPI000B879C4F|nr:hypothetical protein [Asanoa ishikariensis]GIF65320.1 hypothetical protein Ais01nite_33550 [Asanoa ishikariensis]
MSCRRSSRVSTRESIRPSYSTWSTATPSWFADRGLDDAALADLAVFDPTKTVPQDVETLLDTQQISSKIKVSGYEYDVTTGLLRTLVPPRSRDDG